MAVDVVGSIAFLANQINGLEIINVINPLNPIKVDSYPGSIFDMHIQEEFAYLVDWNNGLIILNLSNPSDITFISQFPIAGACVHLDIHEDIAYITDHHSDYTGLRLIDVSDPFHPFQVGSYLPSGIDFWNPIIEGDYTYIGNYAFPNGGRLHIIDVSDPSNIHRMIDLIL